MNSKTYERKPSHQIEELINGSSSTAKQFLSHDLTANEEQIAPLFGTTPDRQGMQTMAKP